MTTFKTPILKESFSVNFRMQDVDNEDINYQINYNEFGQKMLIILQRNDLLVNKQDNSRIWEWIEVFKKRMEKFNLNFAIAKIRELRNKE